MGGFVISGDKFPEVTPEIVEKWKLGNYHFTIEEIADDLRTVFTEEQLRDLEPNYIGFSIAKRYPSETIPAEFLNKTAAIIAINVNPYEYTSDLIAFANMTTVCNDVSLMDINVNIVPSRYISRTLSAVQKITPKNYDFDSVFFHNDIQNYIFQCYYRDSFYLLDDRLVESYNMPFLNNSELPPAATKTILDLRPLTGDVKKFIDENTNSKLFEEEDQKKAIEDMLDGLLAEDNISGFIKEQLRKFAMNYMYDKYYGVLYSKIKEKG